MARVKFLVIAIHKFLDVLRFFLEAGLHLEFVISDFVGHLEGPHANDPA
jgi:hypothetical protein